ncbi:hypothetical protein EYF80_023592 [Liparis tanakae]|uniref:Uncharacterized protein n=1 Tax=Liparis tanakae TaxID=230148 RepID=A0A4Z2HME6_9TELE|nr:hypothetical protein EYF80_023592 [Liparis tanakae]
MPTSPRQRERALSVAPHEVTIGYIQEDTSINTVAREWRAGGDHWLHRCQSARKRDWRDGRLGGNHRGRGPLDAPGERPWSSEESLQGKEGILRLFSLLGGAPGGTSGVSGVSGVRGVSSGGRRQRVWSLCSLLQELVKL